MIVCRIKGYAAQALYTSSLSVARANHVLVRSDDNYNYMLVRYSSYAQPTERSYGRSADRTLRNTPETHLQPGSTSMAL